MHSEELGPPVKTGTVHGYAVSQCLGPGMFSQATSFGQDVVIQLPSLMEHV